MDGLKRLEEKLPTTAPRDEGDALKHSQPVSNNVNMSIMRINTSIMHINTSVQNYIPFRIACLKCNKTFGNAEKLRLHGLIHTRRQPFVCTQCDKQYLALSSLKSHKSTHSGERTFACVNCDQTYLQRSALYTHKCVFILMNVCTPVISVAKYLNIKEI